MYVKRVSEGWELNIAVNTAPIDYLQGTYEDQYKLLEAIQDLIISRHGEDS